jgi:hypothetical protein
MNRNAIIAAGLAGVIGLGIGVAVQPEPEVIVETVTLPAPSPTIVEVPGPIVEVPGPIVEVPVTPAVCIDALYGLNDLIIAMSDVFTVLYEEGEVQDDSPEGRALIRLDTDSIYSDFDECEAAADIGI